MEELKLGAGIHNQRYPFVTFRIDLSSCRESNYVYNAAL